MMFEWLKDVGCKQQSILQSGFRNPDHETHYIKLCVRWLRAQCQVNADPAIDMRKLLLDGAIEELEYCAVHYAHHFADAFGVIAFNHPDQEVRDHAGYLYNQVAEELFHCHPMTQNEFHHRHRDKFGGTK